MKNKGNNGALLVTHDKYPEYGVGVALGGCEERAVAGGEKTIEVQWPNGVRSWALVVNLSLASRSKTQDYQDGLRNGLAGTTDARKAALFRQGGAQESENPAIQDYWTGAWDGLRQRELHPNEEYAEAKAFWDDWICQDCNGGKPMSLKTWKSAHAGQVLKRDDHEDRLNQVK